MKTEIEDMITENKEYFNDSEPLEGHFKRFEARLDKEFGKQKRPVFKIVWQVAAAVVFALLLVNQGLIYFSPKEKQTMSLASVSPEYGEVEMYYTNAINTNLDQWSKFQKEGSLSPKEKQSFDKELVEFEKTFKSLQEELKANPDDERVINAMIEFYQVKLNIITMIVGKMKEVKEVKQLKNTSHETEI